MLARPTNGTGAPGVTVPKLPVPDATVFEVAAATVPLKMGRPIGVGTGVTVELPMTIFGIPAEGKEAVVDAGVDF